MGFEREGNIQAQGYEIEMPTNYVQVSSMDRVMNVEVRCKVGAREHKSERVDRNNLLRFGPKGHMSDEHILPVCSKED